jgi:hypothetical protein
MIRTMAMLCSAGDMVIAEWDTDTISATYSPTDVDPHAGNQEATV